ncbi:MAG: hypothetical protein F4012_08210 [Gemmatimonadales bacterium]|nr:hypothetical protein [Gemmatimonadales bacterium]MYL06781.1 hypothetical protein [Gemmatimonadales bacterium]
MPRACSRPRRCTRSSAAASSTNACDISPGRGRVRKTSVEIDDGLLEQVRILLGTSSIKETIDSALREVLRREARRQEIEALATMDGLELSNEKVMAGAWRS